METQRTPEELKNPEYNYYLAYGIDPAEKDGAKINAAMATKKNGFTQGTPMQRRLKDLYAEAAEIMVNNPAWRQEEFNSAKHIKSQAAEELIVDIGRNRGKIFKSDIIRIANASNKWVSADELANATAYLAKQGVTVIDDTKTAFDFPKYKQIDELLRTLNKPNLYAFLSCQPTASVSELTAAGKTVYSNNKGVSSSAGMATNALCGFVPIIFASDASKKLYDQYLATKDDIWSCLELRRTNGISEISAKEFVAYTEKIESNLRLSKYEAQTLLAEGLCYYHLTVYSERDDQLKGYDAAKIAAILKTLDELRAQVKELLK